MYLNNLQLPFEYQSAVVYTRLTTHLSHLEFLSLSLWLADVKLKRKTDCDFFEPVLFLLLAAYRFNWCHKIRNPLELRPFSFLNCLIGSLWQVAAAALVDFVDYL